MSSFDKLISLYDHDIALINIATDDSLRKISLINICIQYYKSKLELPPNHFWKEFSDVEYLILISLFENQIIDINLRIKAGII